MEKQKTLMSLILLLLLFTSDVSAWTGEIHGRVVCGDLSVGLEDHVLES